MLALLFVGCGGNKTTQVTETEQVKEVAQKEETPEQVVSATLGALRKYDMQTARMHFPEWQFEREFDVENRELKDLMRTILKDMKYSILGSSVEGDSAVVTVKITNTELGSVAKEWFRKLRYSQMASVISGSDPREPKELIDLLKEECRNNRGLGHSATVDIDLIKVSNSWNIDIYSPDLLMAIWGGADGEIRGLIEHFKGE